MKISELISAIENNQFLEATKTLQQEGARLSNFSLGSPFFDLLVKYKKEQWVVKHREDAYTEVASRKLDEMLLLFKAMLDAGLPLEGGLSEQQLKAIHSSSDTDRAFLGLKYSYQTTDAKDVSLWVRLAGIDWPEALDVLRYRQPNWINKQKDPENQERWAAEITESVIQACEFSSFNALENILDHHEFFFNKHQYFRLFSAIFKMEDPPAGLVTRIMDRIELDGDVFNFLMNTFGKLEFTKDVDPDLVLSWLQDRPQHWLALHQKNWEKVQEEDTKSILRNKDRPNYQALTTHLFNALLKRHIQTGQFSSLLDVAFNDPLLVHHTDIKREKTSILSNIIQGEKLNHDVLKPNGPFNPRYTIKNQLRRSIKIIGRLQKHGFVLPEIKEPEFNKYRDVWQAQPSESMKWAQKDWAPTRAFFHRHPEWKIQNSISQSPIGTSKTVETALKWEKLGASSENDQNQVNPWVKSLKYAKDTQKSPWANEISGRLRKKTIALDALADAERINKYDKPQNLKSVMGLSSALVRTWLAVAKKDPDAEIVKLSFDAAQWVLLRQWIEQGKINTTEARLQFLLCLTIPPKSLTDNGKKNFYKLVDALQKSPDFPWPETKEAWNKYWTCARTETHGNYFYAEQIKWQEKGLEILAKWSKENESSWGGNEEDQLNFFHICRVKEKPFHLLPITMSEKDAFAFVENSLLNPELSKHERYRYFSNFLNAVQFEFPLYKLGDELFDRLDNLDQDQDQNHYVAPEVKSFLEQQRLKAQPLTQSAVETVRPGRRL